MASLSRQQVERYLDRIGVRPVGRPDAPTLAGLQLAHLRAVPFENLDIHRSTPIVLDPASLYEKIVERRRGGYCYEVNSTFARLLVALGYGVRFVSARVMREGEIESQEFAHLALLVEVGGEPVPHLVDVGFGDAFETPLPLTSGFERREWGKRVRIVQRAGRWRFEADQGDGWAGGYTFSTTPRTLADFEEMNVWQQTAPESVFRRQPMCTMLVGEARVTLAGDQLIETDASGRRERDVAAVDVPAILRERFGVTPD